MLPVRKSKRNVKKGLREIYASAVFDTVLQMKWEKIE